MSRNIFKNNSGYTVLEIIFYIAVFVILSIAVINSMITMMRSFKEMTIQAQLMQGTNIMERISREVRQAYSINSINTTNLKLNTKDESGLNKTVGFSLQDSNVRFLENDAFVGNLNTDNTSIIELSFIQVDTTKGTAIKIFLTIKSDHDQQNRTENFYNTVVLRGMY